MQAGEMIEIARPDKKEKVDSLQYVELKYKSSLLLQKMELTQFKLS